MRALTGPLLASSLQAFLAMSVRTMAGAMAFAWMLNRPHSAAITCVRLFIPALDALWAPWPSHPETLATDETLMILPHRCLLIPGTAVCASKNGARRFVA